MPMYQEPIDMMTRMMSVPRETKSPGFHRASMPYGFSTTVRGLPSSLAWGTAGAGAAGAGAALLGGAAASFGACALAGAGRSAARPTTIASADVPIERFSFGQMFFISFPFE